MTETQLSMDDDLFLSQSKKQDAAKIDLREKIHPDASGISFVSTSAFGAEKRDALLLSFVYFDPDLGKTSVNLYIVHDPDVPEEKMDLDTLVSRFNVVSDENSRPAVELLSYFNFSGEQLLVGVNESLSSILKLYFGLRLERKALMNHEPPAKADSFPQWIMYEPTKQRYRLQRGLCIDTQYDASRICTCLYRTEAGSKDFSMYYPYGTVSDSSVCGHPDVVSVSTASRSLSYCHKTTPAEVVGCPFYKKDLLLVCTADLTAKFSDNPEVLKILRGYLVRTLKTHSYSINIKIEDLCSSSPSKEVLVRSFDYNGNVFDFLSYSSKNALIEEVYTQLNNILSSYQFDYNFKINSMIRSVDDIVSGEAKTQKVSYIGRILSKRTDNVNGT